jgi:coenzyme F420 biosynthesis associated uncharacterized protein
VTEPGEVAIADRARTEPVDWALAGRVAARVAGRGPQLSDAEKAQLDTQFADATAQAEELVAVQTGLRSASGPARGQVVDRAGWTAANVAGFQRLLAPLTDKVGAHLSRGRGPVRVAQAITGAEVGTLLGWMSSRVLGQYDLLVLEEESPNQQDVVYYVGPNVISVERRFGFPPDQFRLWLAIHETTHRAQFTGVPWMRQHYLGLVNDLTSSFDPDPQRFVGMLRQSISALRSGETSTRDGGLAAVFATPEQREIMARIGGLMSLLEGHGDITMQRAGAAVIPSADRFARVLSERRKSQSGPTKVLQRLLGLEAKMAQYEQGERFVLAIEAAAGPQAIDTCWERAENLPTLQEIREPHRWLDRMGLASAA